MGLGVLGGGSRGRDIEDGRCCYAITAATAHICKMRAFQPGPRLLCGTAWGGGSILGIAGPDPDWPKKFAYSSCPHETVSNRQALTNIDERRLDGMERCRGRQRAVKHRGSLSSFSPPARLAAWASRFSRYPQLQAVCGLLTHHKIISFRMGCTPPPLSAFPTLTRARTL